MFSFSNLSIVYLLALLGTGSAAPRGLPIDYRHNADVSGYSASVSAVSAVPSLNGSMCNATMSNASFASNATALNSTNSTCLLPNSTTTEGGDSNTYGDTSASASTADRYDSNGKAAKATHTGSSHRCKGMEHKSKSSDGKDKHSETGTATDVSAPHGSASVSE